MRDLVIFGAGGMAREVHQLVDDINRERRLWRFRGFLDTNPERHGSQVHDFPVLGDAGWLAEHPDVAVVIGIGSGPARQRMATELAERVAPHRPDFPVLIHPHARVGSRVELGPGTLVCASAILTTDITVGAHVLLNCGCFVGHDAVLGDFATVAPGARICGGVRLGEGADVGAGATVIQGLRVGGWSVVGAGAVVVREMPPAVTAVGVPARPLPQRV